MPGTLLKRLKPPLHAASCGPPASSRRRYVVVTEGRGFVATEDREEALAVGDVALISAGEKYRHGAVAGSNMTHISITAAGSKTEQLEE